MGLDGFPGDSSVIITTRTFFIYKKEPGLNRAPRHHKLQQESRVKHFGCQTIDIEGNKNTLNKPF